MTWKIKNDPKRKLLSKLNGKEEVPVVGETYTIKDVRKGNFEGRILNVVGEWADVEITNGVCKFIADDSRVGDKVIIRAKLCQLTWIES